MILETDNSGYFGKMEKKKLDELLDTIMDLQQVIEPGDTRTRARIQMDLSTTVDIGGNKVMLAEMFETDIGRLVNNYQSQVAGILARSKVSVLNALPIKAGEIDPKKLPEFIIERNGQYYADQTHENFYGWLRNYMESASKKDPGEAHAQLMEDFDMIWRHINGQPMDVTSERDGARLIRAMGNYTTFARGWLFAFATLSELARLFNSRTFVAAATNAPGFIKDVFAFRRAGNLDVAGEWAEFAGMGLDSTVLPSYQRTDGAIGAAESATANLRNFTLSKSMFLAVNNALRLFSLRTEMTQMVRAGKGQVKLNNYALRRMQAYGIPRDRAQGIAELVARNWDAKRGQPNFKAIEAEDWEAAQLLKAYLYRMGKKSSSEALADQTFSWSHSGLADGFLQFQRSSIDGFIVNGIQEVRLHDPEAATGFLAGWVGGAAGYAAVTTLRNYQNEEELKKKLALSEIAKNAFARAAYAGIITKIMDLVAMGLGYQPVFSGRNSASQQGFAPASLQTAASIPAAIGAVTGLPFGATTVSEANKALSLVGGTPLLLVPGIETFLESALPKKAQKGEPDDLLTR
jgi:hypothetical protein